MDEDLRNLIRKASHRAMVVDDVATWEKLQALLDPPDRNSYVLLLRVLRPQLAIPGFSRQAYRLACELAARCLTRFDLSGFDALLLNGHILSFRAIQQSGQSQSHHMLVHDLEDMDHQELLGRVDYIMEFKLDR